MSTLQLKSTGWVARCYNSRGLIPLNIPSKNLVRTSSGVLWAAIRENIQSKFTRIYRSVDNGFSWDLMWAGTFVAPGYRTTAVAGLNTNGGILNLIVDEKKNRLLLLVSFYDTAPTNKYRIEPFVFKLTSSDYLERILALSNNVALPALNTIDYDMDELFYQVAQNDDYLFITQTTQSKLKLSLARIESPMIIEDQPDAPGDHYFNLHDTVCDDRDEVHVVALEDRGANYALVHLNYELNAHAWWPAHTIAEWVANDAFDINLVRSRRGVLVALWTQDLDGGNQITDKYSFSTDEGVTWSTPVDITSDSADFRDTPSQQLTSHLNAIVTLEGDVYVTYVGINAAGNPQTYFKALIWDGTTFTQGPENTIQEFGTGAKFFRATSTNLVSAQDPNNLRVGYQIGQGNSNIQQDTNPVKFRQKALLEGLEIDDDAWEEGEPALNQLQVSFNILGAPNTNVDYYAAGATGPTTRKYLSAFNRIGTSMRLIRYEPAANSYLNDRTAYFKHSEQTVQCLFDSLNYDFPMTSGLEDFKTYIERDTRKLYLPPNVHLTRTFLLNEGEYLKRTVWICLFDNNEYELSQVVPFFYDNQISHYCANAYVVGPSNDPFARPVLPTET